MLFSSVTVFSHEKLLYASGPESSIDDPDSVNVRHRTVHTAEYGTMEYGSVLIVTWSPSGRSRKWGICLAHSTSAVS